MGRAVPFLVDRRATTRFASLAGVVTDVWSRLGQVRSFFRPERIGGAFVGFLFSDWVGGWVRAGYDDTVGFLSLAP